MLKPLLVATTGLITLLTLSINTWSGTDIYTWKDKDGRVHFSEQPAKNADAQKVNIKNSRLGSGYGGTQGDMKKTFKERIEKRNEKKEALEVAANKKKAKDERCASAKKNLSLIAGNVRTRFEMEDGTIRPFTTEELKTKRASIEKSIKENCA